MKSLQNKNSFNHLLFKVLRLTSEQVQDLNDWMIHRGTPNIHEVIVQSFRRPHELKDDLQFIREDKPCYIQSNVMISLSLMITYIKHLRYSAKTKYFGPFYYIQIDPQDYDEWRTTPPNKTCYIKAHVMISLSLMIAYIKHLQHSGKATHFGPFYYIQIDPQDYDEWRIETPEEEIHFQTPSKLGSPATPRSMAPQWHLNPTSPLPTSKRGLKGMQVHTPSSRMKGITTPSFALQGNCQSTRLEQSYGSQLHTRIR